MRITARTDSIYRNTDCFARPEVELGNVPVAPAVGQLAEEVGLVADTVAAVVVGIAADDRAVGIADSQPGSELDVLDRKFRQVADRFVANRLGEVPTAYYAHRTVCMQFDLSSFYDVVRMWPQTIRNCLRRPISK